MSNSILQLRDVKKVYSTGAGDFVALKGITLDVDTGQFLGIVGKSGAGKTTLLNMISGVSEISAGEVLFMPQEASRNGELQPISIGSLSQDELAVWRGKNLGIVYQSFELLPQLDLVNNIMLPQEFAGHYQPAISREKAMELLEIVELTEHAYKLPAHISGGQKQRVAIARALVNDPPVIVADEPTGNLDTVTAETIFQIFAKLVEQGKTVIMVTHDMDLASRFTHRALISDGELVDEIGEADGEEEEALVTNSTEQVIKANGDADEALLSTYTGRDEDSNSIDTSKPAIQLDDVVKTYVNAAGSFEALKGVEMTIEFGQFVSLVGKSGSGKSTLLNMLTGIDHPTSGCVTIGGEDIYSMSESKRALWRGRNVGIVFQFFQLLPTLSLLENTMLPMDYCNVYDYSERPQRAMELLRMVGLEDHAYDLPASVSNGQQQAAAIARSLATDPPIIVADEPTGNLDSRSADVVIRVFRELAARGKTILIVTHDPSLTSRTDRTIIISDGEFIDPTVASVLPSLDHPQMLQATHEMQKRVFEAEETIIRQGELVEYFYMVADGQVSVMDGGSETAVACLETGQFFGEVELMRKETAIANVRANGTPVEVAMIPKEHFYQIMEQSPQTVALLKQVAIERRDENLARSLQEMSL
jgi:ABC-type lipoprotein export system ATPase subunit